MLLTHRSLQPLVALFLFCLLSSAQASAALEIKNAWVAEGPPVAPVLAGYMDIENHTAKDVAITGSSCADFKTVEIHEMRMAGGMMEMKQIEKLIIPAGKTVKLEPGGYHLMLITPKQAFKAGDNVTVTLKLDNGQTLAVNMPVKPRDNSGGHQHHHH